MNIIKPTQAALAIAAFLAVSVTHAANLSDAEYKSGKDRIAAAYEADKSRCASLAGNAKDICAEESKGKEKVARAELEFKHTGKPEDQNKAVVAVSDAAYAVAKEKCDDLAGNAKDVCVKEAQAVHAKGLADAKVGRVVGDANRDAVKDKRDAEYEVAAEKCDALAGDAKSECVNAAKRRFGKG